MNNISCNKPCLLLLFQNITFYFPRWSLYFIPMDGWKTILREHIRQEHNQTQNIVLFQNMSRTSYLIFNHEPLHKHSSCDSRGGRLYCYHDNHISSRDAWAFARSKFRWFKNLVVVNYFLFSNIHWLLFAVSPPSASRHKLIANHPLL